MKKFESMNVVQNFLVGRADFLCFYFQEKYFSRKYFSRYDFGFLFKFNSLFPLLKGRQSPISNSESVNVTKNVIDFKFRKWNLLSNFPAT